MSLGALLAPVTIPLAHSLGLPRLPEYSSTVALSFLSFHAIQWTSPFFFNRWFPEHYGKASKRVKQGWAARACSMFHAVIVVIMAWRCVALPELNNDKVSGMHMIEGEMEAFACGFLWDAMEETLVHFQDIGLALHGILVLAGVGLTFRPLFAYTSVRLLFLEISTPLLNIHWFLDKTGRTGTTLQLVNGIALVIVFFLTRICYGSVTSYRFLITLHDARVQLSPFLSLIYAVGTASLQLLNCLWMYKMLAALRKRFPSQEHKVKAE
ncbi:DUF887-domain-containing protein [Gautieria morchelliformis]|nr:DUF887-domain-containing protein [Gautieria morchelliformis]